MSNDAINLRRTSMVLKPDQSRVLLRPFNPGDSQRAGRIIARIMALPEEQVGPLLDEVSAEFSQRHQEIRRMFLERFEQVRLEHDPKGDLSEQRRLLIGSYFLAEYSLESAALFNPSIVPHPDQAGLPTGALRFILSLRATGEGHISSITFRTGIIHSNSRIEVLDAAGFLTEPRQIPNPAYEKGLFARKLRELGLNGEFTAGSWIDWAIRSPCRSCDAPSMLRWIRNVNRKVSCKMTRTPHTGSGCWLGPTTRSSSSPNSSFLSASCFRPRRRKATASRMRGLSVSENDDGSYIYYATFTAFDGKVVMPELVETVDFLRFRFITLNGPAAQNKGMAMFPRKIDGHYAMLARQDNESIYLSYSDNIHFWNERKVLLRPTFSWELIQIGNCGSPIETDAGWLVLSHGVGPLRKYCIGAFLLDRDDPSKVIGRLRAPLLQPNENERKGYVPNVVYTCGALLHKGELIIPYGLADHATGFATVPVGDVLAAMECAKG